MKSDYMIALQQVLPLLESEGMYEQSATLCEALMMRLEKCTDESCAVDDDEGDDISSIDSVREQIQSQPRGSFKDGKKARSRADPKSSSSALGSDGVKRDSYGYAIEPRQVTPASTDLRITAPSLMRADEVNGAADEPSKRQKSAVSDDVSTTETSRMSESIPTSNEAVSKVPNLVLDLHGYPITIARAAVRTVLYKAQVQYIDTQIALQRKRVEAMVHKMAAKRRDTTSDASAQNTSIVSEDAQAPIYVADNGDGGDLTDENAYMNVVESIQTEKPLLGNLELITGIGRGSASQESTIKPHVKEWLARQFSPPLRAVELTDNPGRLIVPERDLRDWIECGVELPIQPREPPE
jgi:DNA-nicking Smr family endonuclease